MSAAGRKDAFMKNRRLKGAMTVEMSVIIPLILFLVMGLVISVFYFHDKNILNGAASETAIVGTRRLGEGKAITEEELEGLCLERVNGKCFFLTRHTITVSIEKEEIIVEIFAKKKKFAVSVTKRAVMTQPEKKIRNIRRLDSKNGEKNYD